MGQVLMKVRENGAANINEYLKERKNVRVRAGTDIEGH